VERTSTEISSSFGARGWPKRIHGGWYSGHFVRTTDGGVVGRRGSWFAGGPQKWFARWECSASGHSSALARPRSNLHFPGAENSFDSTTRIRRGAEKKSEFEGADRGRKGRLEHGEGKGAGAGKKTQKKKKKKKKN